MNASIPPPQDADQTDQATQRRSPRDDEEGRTATRQDGISVIGLIQTSGRTGQPSNQTFEFGRIVLGPEATDGEIARAALEMIARGSRLTP